MRNYRSSCHACAWKSHDKKQTGAGTNYVDNLVTRTQPCVLSVADECLNKELITQDDYDGVPFDQTQTKQQESLGARTLLLAVCECKEGNWFEEFLAILSTEENFDDLIQELKEVRKEAHARQEYQSQDQLVPNGENSATSEGRQANPDQHVPDEDEATLDEAALAESNERQVTWKDTGLHSRSLTSEDVDTFNEQLVSHPRNITAQMSRDSGISRGSSSDCFSPVEETPEGREGSARFDASQSRRSSNVLYVSRRLQNIDRLQSILVNLRMELMQHEAVEDDLKDQVSILREKLGTTIQEKEQTAEALRLTTEQVSSLRQRQDTLQADITDRESQLEELKSRLSNSEVEKNQLKEQYEQDIKSLRSQLETVSAERDAKENELKETKQKLDAEIKTAAGLREAICILEQENSLLSYKCSVESEEKQQKLKQELEKSEEQQCWFRRQLSNEKRQRICLEKQILCLVAVIVIFFAVAFPFLLSYWGCLYS